MIEPREERTLRRLAPIIEPCLRVMGRDLRRARDDYFRRVDRETGPDPSRGTWIREVYPRQLERCRTAVEAVASTPPSMNEIDAAAARLVSADGTRPDAVGTSSSSRCRSRGRWRRSWRPSRSSRAAS